MKLNWVGHSCFRMTAQDGTVIVTDPYDDSVGIDMVPLRADLVTMSHEHHDHGCEQMLAGHPVIARGVEEARVGGVRTRTVQSYHDEVRGAKRGGNALRIFAIDGMKIVHAGDLGCMPDKAVLEAIADADVLMLPVGGFYTIGAEEARRVAGAARARCVIPMHFKTARCGYPIAGVAPFLAAMGAQGAQPVRELELVPGHVPEGVVLMQPEADTL